MTTCAITNFSITIDGYQEYLPTICCKIITDDGIIHIFYISDVNRCLLHKLKLSLNDNNDDNNDNSDKIKIDLYSFDYESIIIEKDDNDITLVNFVPRESLVDDSTNKVIYEKVKPLNILYEDFLPILEELTDKVGFIIGCDDETDDDEIKEEESINEVGITQSGNKYIITTIYNEKGVNITKIVMYDTKSNNDNIFKFGVIHCKEYWLIIKNIVDNIVQKESRNYCNKADQLPIISENHNLFNIYSMCGSNSFVTPILYSQNGYSINDHIRYSLSDFREILSQVYKHMDYGQLYNKNSILKSYTTLFPKESSENHLFYYIGLDDILLKNRNHNNISWASYFCFDNENDTRLI